MKYDKDNIAFPDYQNENQTFFNRSASHDVAQWNYVKSILTNFRTCLDIGGHVGTTAIRYSKHFEKVVTFEPIPDLFECMQVNTENYENIEINNLAVSDKNDVVDIWMNKNNTGSNVIESPATNRIVKSRWYNDKRQDFKQMPKISVKSSTIDSFAFDNVDFIKIDTEGYNIEPLRGMKETLEKYHPVVQLERANDPRFLNETHDFLFTLGYKLVRTLGNPSDDIFVYG